MFLCSVFTSWTLLNNVNLLVAFFVVGTSTFIDGGNNEITTSNFATLMYILIGVGIFIVFIVLPLCAVMVMVAYIVHYVKKRYDLLLFLDYVLQSNKSKISNYNQMTYLLKKAFVSFFRFQIMYC